jgi:hypothetical protein
MMVFMSVRFLMAAPVFHASKGASSTGLAGAAMARAAWAPLRRRFWPCGRPAGGGAWPGRTKKPCHTGAGAMHLQGACAPRACIALHCLWTHSHASVSGVGCAAAEGKSCSCFTLSRALAAQEGFLYSTFC